MLCSGKGRSYNTLQRVRNAVFFPSGFVPSSFESLPLHAKQTGEANWELLAERASHMSIAADFAFYKGFYTSIGASPLRFLPAPKHVPRATISASDLQLLLERNFVEHLPAGEVPVGVVLLRAIPEKLWTQPRRRLIAEPRDANSLEACDIPDEHKFSLPSVRENGLYASSVKTKDGTYTFCADCAFMYGHFVMPPEIRNFHCFRSPEECADEGVYRLRTIPTGGRPCAGVAQLSLRVLTARLNATAAAVADLPCYIDNIKASNTCMALGVDDVLALTELAGRCRLRLNESQENLLAQLAREEHEFLAIVYDTTRREWRLADRVVQKLLAATDRILDPAITFEEVLGIMGLMTYALQLYAPQHRHPIEYYYRWKFLRRRSRWSSPKEPAHIWPSLLEAWKLELMRLAANPSLPWPNDSPDEHHATMITDASLSGWAAILFDEHGTSVIAGSWDSDFIERCAPHIAELELLAVEFGFDSFETPATSFDVYIDNEEARFGLTHFRLRNFVRLRCVDRIGKSLARRGARLNEVRYIKSAENVADPWSRIFAR